MQDEAVGLSGQIRQVRIGDMREGAVHPGQAQLLIQVMAAVAARITLHPAQNKESGGFQLPSPPKIIVIVCNRRRDDISLRERKTGRVMAKDKFRL